MSVRAAATFLISWIVMLGLAGCPGDTEIAQVAGVGQVAQQNEIAEPDKAHPFIDLDPGDHIQPATTRDTLPGSGEVRAGKVSGKYFDDSQEAKADPRVLDDAFAERLWTESERLIATARA